ncbi:MAG: type VI secretion system baseplate subunit TssE [Polyangia bacterium]
MTAANRYPLRASLLRRLQDESFDPFPDQTGRIDDAAEFRASDPSALDLGYVTPSRFRDDLLSDLNHLLRTTRLTVKPLGSRYPELKKSIYNYGLPDRAGFGYSSADQVRLADELAAALRVFEPRLQRVTVEPGEAQVEDSAAVFRISAQLRIPPRPEAVSLAATLPVHSKVFTVKDQPLPQESQHLYDFYLNLIDE